MGFLLAGAGPWGPGLEVRLCHSAAERPAGMQGSSPSEPPVLHLGNGNVAPAHRCGLGLPGAL